MIELLFNGSEFIRTDTGKRIFPTPIGKPANVKLVSKSKPPKGELQKLVKTLENSTYFHTTPGDYTKPERANAFCLGDPLTERIEIGKKLIRYSTPVQYYEI